MSFLCACTLSNNTVFKDRDSFRAFTHVSSLNPMVRMLYWWWSDSSNWQVKRTLEQRPNKSITIRIWAEAARNLGFHCFPSETEIQRGLCGIGLDKWDTISLRSVLLSSSARLQWIDEFKRRADSQDLDLKTYSQSFKTYSQSLKTIERLFPTWTRRTLKLVLILLTGSNIFLVKYSPSAWTKALFFEGNP